MQLNGQTTSLCLDRPQLQELLFALQVCWLCFICIAVTFRFYCPYHAFKTSQMSGNVHSTDIHGERASLRLFGLARYKDFLNISFLAYWTSGMSADLLKHHAGLGSGHFPSLAACRLPVADRFQRRASERYVRQYRGQLFEEV